MHAASETQENAGGDCANGGRAAVPVENIQQVERIAHAAQYVADWMKMQERAKRTGG